MGQRIYKVPIDNVTIGTAVQDLFALVCDASRMIELHSIHLDAVATAEASLRMRLKRGTATVTIGSGGTNVTPVKAASDDGAATGITAHINDTTQATTSGAFTNLGEFNWDVSLPFDYLPPPEDRDWAFVSEGLILDLPATIASTVVSGMICFRVFG